MAKLQHLDNQISLALNFVKEDRIPTKNNIYKVRSRNARKLFYQFNRLILKKGVLHRLYIQEDIEYHQLVLPQKLQGKVLEALHDNMGHQALERTLDLLRERVYWPSMTSDTTRWIGECRHCQVARGDYNNPKPILGQIEANHPLELLCLDFTKIDPAKNGKENVLVLTDAFTKFSLAVVTSNQKALTVAKVLVDKWFHTYGVPNRIHSDQGKSFDNEIIGSLCKLYGIEQTTTCPYNPRGNAFCERFNHTLFGLLKTLTKGEKEKWPAHLPALCFAYNATPHSVTGF